MKPVPFPHVKIPPAPKHNHTMYFRHLTLRDYTAWFTTIHETKETPWEKQIKTPVLEEHSNFKRNARKKSNALLIINQEAAFLSHRFKRETNCFLQPGQMDQKNQNKPCAYGPRHHLVLHSNNVTFPVCSSPQITCSMLYLKYIYMQTHYTTCVFLQDLRIY